MHRLLNDDKGMVTFDTRHPQIERRIYTKSINIDSIFRNQSLHPLSTDFIWTLPSRITNVIEMRLAACEIPMSFYQFNKSNNTFKVTVFNFMNTDTNVLVASATNLITIPPGNYVVSDFMEAINAIFLNTGNGLQYLILTISNKSGKTTIRARDVNDPFTFGSTPFNSEDPSTYSPSFYFSIQFSETPPPPPPCPTPKAAAPVIDLTVLAGWMMGFRLANYIVTTTTVDITSTTGTTAFQCSLVSESFYGSSIPRYCFLEVNDYNKSCVSDQTISYQGSSSYIGGNILGRIPLSANYNCMLFETQRDFIMKQRDYFGKVNIERLHIRLVDRYGVPIDLNKNDMSVCIEFTIVY